MIRILRDVTITIALLLVMLQPSLAMSPNPNVINAVQPDGQQIQLRFKGSMQLNWHEDLQGYPVVHNNGTWVYQQSPDPAAALSDTPLEVGKVDPKQAGVKQISYDERLQFEPQSTVSESMNPPGPPLSVPANGIVKNLVVLIRFSDHASRTLPSQSDIHVLFNAVGGDPLLAPTGSVNDVYMENSYGEMNLVSTVLPWFTVSNTEAYYANGASGFPPDGGKIQEALLEALDNADVIVDFSQFDLDGDGSIDAVTFVHSGYAAELGATSVDADGAVVADRIWSHKASISPAWESTESVKVDEYNINPGLWGLTGSEIGRIGVIVHELGHFFGLPDLYDKDGTGSGIGNWGLMANSWGWDQSQRYPPHFSAWSKVKLGFVTPTTVTATGTYSVPQVQTNKVIYKIDSGFPDGEYLLLENRQAVGFDQQITTGGLLIWHIDESRPNNTSSPNYGTWPGQADWPNAHYKVALLQADGTYALEKGLNQGNNFDTYRSTYTDSIGPTTVPSTNSYQGTMFETGIEIGNISAVSANMTFDLLETPLTNTFDAPLGGETYVVGTTTLVEWHTCNGSGISCQGGSRDFALGANCQPFIENGHNYFTWTSYYIDGYSWSTQSTNPHTGTYHEFAENAAIVTDQHFRGDSYFIVPANNARLSFWHDYDTENGFDGGVVELSIDDGANWQDLGSRMTLSAYNNIISSAHGNPLAGRIAFSGDSNGYVNTIVDLSDFAGQNAAIRFRLGTDASISDVGWSVDLDALVVTGDAEPQWTSLGTHASPSFSWDVFGAPGPNHCLRLTGGSYNGVPHDPVISGLFTLAPPSPAPSIVSPAPGSVLSGSNATFAWTANGYPDYEGWYLQVGSSPEATDYYDSGLLPANHYQLTESAYGLPTDGSNVYVTLRYVLGGSVGIAVNETYIAGTAGSNIPALTTPAPNATLTGTSQVFAWSDNGVEFAYWNLIVGSTYDGYDYLNSANNQSSVPSVTANGLPTDGSTVYARFSYYILGDGFQYVRYTYTASTPPPSLSSPLPGSTLSGDSEVFSWLANGSQITFWDLWLGSVAGGADYFDADGAGSPPPSQTSITTTGLPTDGSTIYATFWYWDTSWHSIPYTYIAASIAPPTLDSPTPGSTLSGESPLFTWVTNGTLVDEWDLLVGSSVGASDYYAELAIPGAQTSTTAAGLPTDGSALHGTLVARYNGVEVGNSQYTYTAATISNTPTFSSPAAGDTLTASSEAFSWSNNGTPVDEWWVYAGTSAGDNSYYDSGNLGAATSTTITGLPNDGSTVVVTLYYRQTGGTWSTVSSSYTAVTGGAGTPGISSPVEGATFASTSETFSWTNNGTPVDEWWVYAGTSAGDSSYYSSGNLGAATSTTITGLPNDGSTVVVTLYYRQTGGTWSTVSSSYTAVTGGAGSPGITTPLAGTTLSGSDVVFAWADNGTPVDEWWVYAGTAAGSSSYFDSGNLGAASTINITGLPTDGSVVYITLYYRQSGGGWQTVVVTYNAVGDT